MTLNIVLISCARAAAALLMGAVLYGGQADQASNAEKQKPPAAKKPGPDLAELMGLPKVDQATLERGRKLFVPTCGFCHGNDARGKSGPDLLRSAVVLHDNKGDTLGPVIRNGRPDRGMPAFSSLTSEQIADISTFLHALAADVKNRFAYKIGDIVTGDPAKGEAFFRGAGHCNSCHSPNGDLAHVAGKYDAVELQRRMLYPSPNLIDLFLGRAGKPAVPTKVTVHLSGGHTLAGTLDHLDEFAVTMHDSAGWYHSFSRKAVKVDVDDLRAAHLALLPEYTDDEMHNVLAYLETLK